MLDTLERPVRHALALHPDELTIPHMVALVGLYNGHDAAIAHEFLRDRTGEKRSGEIMLSLIIGKLITQSRERPGYALTGRGHYIAARIVARVMANL